MTPALSLRITALATLLTIAFSLGCRPYDMPNIPDRKRNPDTQRTQPITITWGFGSMEVPPNWSKSDLGGRGGLRVHYVPTPEEGLVARVGLGARAWEFDKVKEMQEMDEKLRTFVSKSKIKIDGHDATKLITSKDEDERKDSRFVTVWVPLKNRTICFEAHGSPKEINARMADIDFMLKSAKFQEVGFFDK